MSEEIHQSVYQRIDQVLSLQGGLPHENRSGNCLMNVFTTGSFNLWWFTVQNSFVVHPLSDKNIKQWAELATLLNGMWIQKSLELETYHIVGWKQETQQSTRTTSPDLSLKLQGYRTNSQMSTLIGYVYTISSLVVSIPKVNLNSSFTLKQHPAFTVCLLMNSFRDFVQQ
jgi:hypothetical protein